MSPGQWMRQFFWQFGRARLFALPGQFLPFACCPTQRHQKVVFEGVSTVASEVPMVLVPDGSAAETLAGVFAVTSEVPKFSVCDCSCESKSVFPVDAPAAKRLKVTPTQHDSIDATPYRGEPQFLPAPGPGPQSSPVETPTPSHLPSGVSKLQRAMTFGVSPSPPLLLHLTMKFSWVSQPSSACRSPPSVPSFSSITSTRKGTPAP